MLAPFFFLMSLNLLLARYTCFQSRKPVIGEYRHRLPTLRINQKRHQLEEKPELQNTVL